MEYQQGDILIVQVNENEIEKSKNWKVSRSSDDGPFKFMQIGDKIEEDLIGTTLSLSNSCRPWFKQRNSDDDICSFCSFYRNTV